MQKSGQWAALCLFSMLLTIAAVNWLQPRVVNGQQENRNQKAVELFTIASATANEAAAASVSNQEISIAAVRTQRINVASDVLRADRAPGRLSLPLFDGKTFEVERDAADGLEARANDDTTWRGKIIGDADSSITLTQKNGKLVGLIFAPGAVYEIAPTADGHALAEIDSSRYPDCHGDVKASVEELSETVAGQANKFAAAPQNNTTLIDSGDRIDVLVLYTPAAAAGFGGAQNAGASIQNAIDVSNTAYRNSQIRMRTRLVGAVEFGYTETATFSADLQAIRVNAAIIALRNQYKADLVALITEGMRGNSCGIGYIPQIALGQGNAAFGFSVTARQCLGGNITLTHELGHNMGAQHNPENIGTDSNGNPVPGAFSYSIGHYDAAGRFITMMSNQVGCANCPRIPHFSNPSVSFAGFPTGIEGQRDNARTLNNTADMVANYVYSGSSLQLVSLDKRGNWSRNQRRKVRWNSGNLAGAVQIQISYDNGQTYQTLVASTANDGEEIVALGMQKSKFARVRVVSLADGWVTDSSASNFVVH